MQVSTSEFNIFVPLDRSPEAQSLTVRALIQRALQGRIRIPDFQRPLRWRLEDNRKFFDSLWRGYPVGSLLFWKKRASAGRIKIGSHTLDAAEVSDAWWVVDGQQRLTALAACLLDLNQGTDSRWRLFFDPDLPGFRSEDPRTLKGTVVPLNALGDLRRLTAWYRQSSTTDAQWNAIEEAQQRILEFTFPVYVVETENADALRGVFARMNSTGASMRADEVFQALIGRTSDPQSPNLDHLQKFCDQNEFGEPGRAEVLKAVQAMSGLDPSRRFEEVGAREALQLVSRSEAEAALTLTVTFLQHLCHIPHLRLIPYPVIFIILAKWFHVFPSNDEPTYHRLARWVWQGAFTGVHVRSEVSRMREQLAFIRPTTKAHLALKRLELVVARQDIRPWTLRPFKSKSAHSRLELLALLELDPDYPSFGHSSLRALLDAPQFAAEIFRSSALTHLGDADLELARSIANRILLEGKLGRSSIIRNWKPEENQQSLASHLISEEAFQALLNRDVATFLRHRAHAIQGHMRRFIEKRTEWQRPHIRSVDEYVDEVDAVDQPTPFQPVGDANSQQKLGIDRPKADAKPVENVGLSGVPGPEIAIDAQVQLRLL